MTSRQPTRLLTLVVGCIWGCVVLAAGCSQQASSGEAREGRSPKAATAVAIGSNVGLRAPSIMLPTLKGEPVELSAFQGKVVLVNFWATWCGPCLIEMPSMQRLYEKLGNERFEILAISSDFEGAAVVKPYVDRLRLTFPILLDPRFQANNTYKITAIPTTVVIDRDGVITHKFFGARDWDTAESHKLISQLLRART